MMILAISVIVLVVGLLFLSFSSAKAIKHISIFTSTLGVSPLLVGLVVLSIGTDMPELANSITSCLLGHGDINLGDSLGSILTQSTLVIGLIPLITKGFKIKRREILILGAFESLAVLLMIFVIQNGLTRLNALLLIASWPVFLFLLKEASPEKGIRMKHTEIETSKSIYFHITLALLSFVGVGLGSYAVVQSVITISIELNIPEFMISFFMVGLGTSLPELAVDIEGIRKGHVQLVLGDIIGSCIFDALVAVAAGPLLVPCGPGNSVTYIIGLYVVLAIAIVTATLAYRKKLDKKAGLLFIVVYCISYSLLFIGG
jgi:cation:H+ antiporter